jgi:hypothetical protein
MRPGSGSDTQALVLAEVCQDVEKVTYLSQTGSGRITRYAGVKRQDGRCTRRSGGSRRKVARDGPRPLHKSKST